MNIQAGSAVLDVGCGPATDTIPLSEYVGARGCVVGLDNDPEMVKKANQEIENLGLTKRIKHMKGTATSMPFPTANSKRANPRSPPMIEVGWVRKSVNFQEYLIAEPSMKETRERESCNLEAV